jgi:glycosyltransferase involved in cell wall biosynthesis
MVDPASNAITTESEKSPKFSSPKVSIITVVLNAKEDFQITLESILQQDYPNIEYLVIDGKSTDGTVEVIERYRDRISYWISEPDEGISDAWNKALSVCQGDIIGLVNAGDRLPADYVSKMAAKIAIDRAIVGFGDAIVVDRSNRQLKVCRGKMKAGLFYNGLGFRHPGCFATRRLYDTIGNFNPHYRLAMDSDWLLRAYRAGAIFQKVDATCTIVDGGISIRYHLAAYGEYLQAMKENGFPAYQIHLAMMIFGFRGFVKSLLIDNPLQ